MNARQGELLKYRLTLREEICAAAGAFSLARCRADGGCTRDFQVLREWE